jgi:hypothetical protein
MKNLILVSSSLLLTSGLSFSNKNYDNYTGKKFVTYGKSHINESTSQDGQNASIRLYPKKKLTDASLYATDSKTAPKIQLKIFTKAPIGTLVELHLGKRGECSYPTGVHSVYQAFTNNQNAWEELIFTFSHVPKESQVKSNEIDHFVLMFAPSYPAFAINSFQG